MSPESLELWRWGALLVALGLALLALATYMFWLMFLGAMSIYRAHLLGRIPTEVSRIVLLTVAVTVLVDWLFNFTLAVVVFREFPKHRWELVTHRLVRYVNIDLSAPQPEIQRLRKHRADIICKRFLDPFDPSSLGHCTAEQGQFFDVEALRRG